MKSGGYMPDQNQQTPYAAFLALPRNGNNRLWAWLVAFWLGIILLIGCSSPYKGEALNVLDTTYRPQLFSYKSSETVELSWSWLTTGLPSTPKRISPQFFERKLEVEVLTFNTNFPNIETAEAIEKDGLRYAGTMANCFGEMAVQEENLLTLRQHLPGAFALV